MRAGIGAWDVVGAIRLFLALVVAAGHVQAITLAPAGLGLPGFYMLGMNAGYAVMFFYMVSGFLISMGLDRKYAPTAEGTIEFYKSRFVRIFSLYWPMVAVVLIALPDVRGSFLADSIPDKFTNLFLFGIDWRLAFATYPKPHWDAALFGLRQTWTLGAELTFYLLAPFLLRSWKLTSIAFAASVATRIAAVWMVGFNEVWTYYFLPSTFLFFLIGHLAQSASQRWSWLGTPVLGCLSLAVAIAMLLVGSYTTWDSPRFWISVLCFAAALPGVFQATKRTAFLNALGNLSYPVYLTHTLVISLLIENGYLPGLASRLKSGELVSAISLAIFMAAAVAAHWLLERPTAAVMRWIIRHCSSAIDDARVYQT
jgi:peptidoglycan/LPS O-acetylase OafA/YrhL